MPANVLLIGPRASGKTTIGRLLAAKFGRPFVDLDDLVRASFDESTVHEIWEVHGERGWREHEVTALQQTLQADGQVIALGGGVPCIDAARELIDRQRDAGRAVSVYLKVPVDELIRRLREEAGDRPSLTGRGAIDEVAEVVAQRESTYRAAADVIIETNSRSAEQITESVITAISACKNGNGDPLAGSKS